MVLEQRVIELGNPLAVMDAYVVANLGKEATQQAREKSDEKRMQEAKKRLGLRLKKSNTMSKASLSESNEMYQMRSDPIELEIGQADDSNKCFDLAK